MDAGETDPDKACFVRCSTSVPYGGEYGGPTNANLFEQVRKAAAHPNLPPHATHPPCIPLTRLF
jgi:hypothetical protein